MKKQTLLFLLFLSACQTPVTMLPEVKDDELQKEKALQTRMIDETKARGGVPLNWRRKEGMVKQFERVAGRIEQAGAAVCREMGMPQQGQGCYYYFALSTNRDINAYADGKHIVINAGMMRFVQNDDELAAIVGHEFAHNLMGHRKAIETNAVIGALAGAVLDGVANSGSYYYSNDFTQAGAELGAISFSPDFEREADYVGTYIMARAGYNPRRATDYWRRLSVQEPDGENGGLTHPSNPERVVLLQHFVNEIAYKRKHGVSVIPDVK